MRIAAGIEYDGTAYNGWQRVASGTGVQAVVEQALGRVADHDVEVVCAGRTDAGVHATAQVVHFDTMSRRDERSWLLGANANLPDDVNLTWVRPVDDDFHARYSAIARLYRYLVLNRLVRSALFRMPAGASLPEHTHPGWVQVVVLEGAITVTQAGAAPHRVPPGGCYFVQPGETHAEQALVDSIVLVTQAEDRPEFGG